MRRRRRCPAVRVERSSSDADGGFALVELLLVIGLAAWLSAGAWAWAWAATRTGAGVVDGGEAATALAYARRTILADVRAADGLASDGDCHTTAVTLQVPGEYRADGSVTIVWNAARGVVWRVAPACHVAGGVGLFRVEYLDADGGVIDPTSDGTVSSWRDRVAGLAVEMRVRANGRTAAGHWSAWFAGRAP